MGYQVIERELLYCLCLSNTIEAADSTTSTSSHQLNLSAKFKWISIISDEFCRLASSENADGRAI